MDDLFLSVVTHCPHIICVVETWLGSEINSSEIDIPGYQLFRKDRNRQGGSVLMYIADFMSVTMLPDPDPQLELLALSVRYNNSKVNLCLLYRPPNSGSHIFDILVSYFDLICVGSFSNFIFIGDFNVNFTDITHPYCNTLQSIMSLYSLCQLFLIPPTHITVAPRQPLISFL